MGAQKMSEYKELEPICRRLDEFPLLIGKIPDCICVHIQEMLDRTCEDLEEDMDSFGTQYETFDAAFGGDIFILKELDDLRAIEIGIVGEDGHWLTLLDGYCQWFEIVEQVGERDENGIGEFILIVHCNNNSGGPSYFIPRSIYYESKHLQDLVEVYRNEG